MSMSSGHPSSDVNEVGAKATRLQIVRRIVRRVLGHPGNAQAPVAALTRAVAWQAYKRIVGRPVDVCFPGGFLVRCHPDSNSASSVIYFNRLFDWDEMQFCRRFLRPGDRALDIGGNIGVYTLLMAHLVGERGHVDVFEPFPRHAARIRENVSLNHFESRVTINEVALSDADGESLFVVDRDVSNRVPTSTDAAAAKITVALRRLDTVVASREPIAFAKLDVEGLEAAVLRGARGLGVAAPMVWVFETNEGLLQKRGTSFAEIARLFQETGYDLWDFDVDANELRAVEGPRANLFAVKKDALGIVQQRLSSSPPPSPSSPWFR